MSAQKKDERIRKHIPSLRGGERRLGGRRTQSVASVPVLDPTGNQCRRNNPAFDTVRIGVGQTEIRLLGH